MEEIPRETTTTPSTRSNAAPNRHTNDELTAIFYSEKPLGFKVVITGEEIDKQTLEKKYIEPIAYYRKLAAELKVLSRSTILASFFTPNLFTTCYRI